MNKIVTIILIFGMYICQSCFSQNVKRHDIQGTYVYKIDGMKWALQIKQNSFTMLEYYKTPMSLFTFGNDTIAVGKVKYEDMNFVKLISDNFIRKTYQDMTITESYDDTIKDSIRIHFIFNSNMEDLRNLLNIQVRTVNRLISLETKATQIVLAKNDIRNKSIAFHITNALPWSSPGFKYNNLSPMEISQLYIPLKKENANVLTVDISSTPRDFFTRFYINNEYCKVLPNSITWRDKVFRKISDDIIDLETLRACLNFLQ